MFGYWEWQLRHRRTELVASLETCNSKGEKITDLMSASLSLCLTASSWKKAPYRFSGCYMIIKCKTFFFFDLCMIHVLSVPLISYFGKHYHLFEIINVDKYMYFTKSITCWFKELSSYLVCPQELKEGIDVVLGDAVNNLPFVPYKLHDHLGNIQPDSSLQTNENQNHY